jgi:hypothetical protein
MFLRHKRTKLSLENIETNKFKISNGFDIEEPVVANLVFHQTDGGKLILAWDFTIYTPEDHIWVLGLMPQMGNY